jgi:energy-coupling factor transport system ATP-binding protein
MERRNPLLNKCFEIQNLTFYFPEQGKETLQDVSFALEPGQFVTLVGPSGCGISTLLRQLKTVLTPHGVKTGEILFEGKPLDTIDLREQSARIGFVQQSPENQIVTDKVWHELAFGLESLGFDTPTIRGRVAEMASFFGIQTWFYKNVTELSGGQKQLLNLASIMAMQPSVLILDEPTRQLDPIAASDFLATVGKINRELGTTVIMTEHRLEGVFPMSDRVLVMDEGRIIADGPPREVGAELKDTGHTMFLAMPTAMRVWAAVPNHAACPITVRDGRDWLTDFAAGNPRYRTKSGITRSCRGCCHHP